MPTIQTITITVGAELPDIGFRYPDANGNPIPFATQAHTFRFEIDTPTLFTKTTGFTFADTFPNATMAITAGDFDGLSAYPARVYGGRLWAKRTSDSKDWEPLSFHVILRQAYS